MPRQVATGDTGNAAPVATKATKPAKATAPSKRRAISSKDQIEKKTRRTIPLALKAEFIKEVQAGLERDPRFPISVVCRRDKYNFYPQKGISLFNNASEILGKIAQLGSHNSMLITKLYPRKMDVIENFLYLSFKKELENGRCTSPERAGRRAQGATEGGFGGSGYMTRELFQSWLEKFEAAMVLEGRNIALVMDNALGHGNTDEYKLSNITIIRLPPKTTSVSQPLDAGIIRTLAKAWDDVTSTTIRNCFAHVPTILAAMQEELRVPTTDDKDEEMEKIRQELMALYPDRAEAIQRQKDFGVLAYLKCCEGRGPSQGLMVAIKEVSGDDKFRGFFLPPGSISVVDEDQDDDDDASDPDHILPNRPIQAIIHDDRRIMERQSGPHEMALPPSEPSSQESVCNDADQMSSPPEDVADETLKDLDETLDLVAEFEESKKLYYKRDPDERIHIAALLKRRLEMASNVMML
ncbi:hypothetical protein BGZ99_007001 [Dissophora globulifera]|uniref:DDE-1 domain-containing protein n=1 Tax=Dissophora globulifera TaxID=979702 RepID=A0A9P6RF15_9FUNG|nr:hypothetical protein BGZ99_007001 [Dissophora globulifera]